MSLRWRTRMPASAETLPGRATRLYEVPASHAVTGAPLEGPWEGAHDIATFALGCFWGAERIFWRIPGVVSTAAGYAGGTTPHPTYEEVCTGLTGHAESVQVVFDPSVVSYAELLRHFWEAHDPTQGFRQGNDVGTEYRSAVFARSAAQLQTAEESREMYGAALAAAGRGPITTEIAESGPFYYAEGYHQQYLHKVPYGYCGLGGTGVSCPVPPAGAAIPMASGNGSEARQGSPSAH